MEGIVYLRSRHERRKRARRRLTSSAFVVGIAVVAMLGVVDSALANHRCTRFGPTPLYYDSSACDVNGLRTESEYYTPSVAIRNQTYSTSSIGNNKNMCSGWAESSGYVFDWTCGWDDFVLAPNPPNRYIKAWCDSVPTWDEFYGRCTVWWHG